jgi:hypothetical protein
MKHTTIIAQLLIPNFNQQTLRKEEDSLKDAMREFPAVNNSADHHLPGYEASEPDKNLS